MNIVVPPWQAAEDAEAALEAGADPGWHSTPQWPSPIARAPRGDRGGGDLTPVREGSSVAEVHACMYTRRRDPSGTPHIEKSYVQPGLALSHPIVHHVKFTEF